MISFQIKLFTISRRIEPDLAQTINYFFSFHVDLFNTPLLQWSLILKFLLFERLKMESWLNYMTRLLMWAATTKEEQAKRT
jgi:hypothetical protein